MIRVVGRTTDERDVVAGVFRFYETEGLPLDILFEALLLKGCIPDWVSFYREALSVGMSPDRIFAKLEPALLDVYGAKFRDVVLTKLRAL